MSETALKCQRKRVAAGPALGMVLAAVLLGMNAAHADKSEKSQPMEMNVSNTYSPETLRISTRRDLNAPAETVWDIIAGFDSLPDYHASIVHSELKQGGVVRHITMSDAAGGGIVAERLVFYDDVDMTFSYRIIDLVDCEMAFRNYQAWVHLEPTGENTCRLHWGSNFDVEGATDEETDELARIIYKGCFDGVQSVLESRK